MSDCRSFDDGPSNTNDPENKGNSRKVKKFNQKIRILHMAGRNITYLSEANLITCVLQTGLAEGVLDAAKNCGAQGAPSVMPEERAFEKEWGLLGVTIDEQKEVIRIIVSEEQADRVFEAMYLAGGLDTPGKE